MMAAALAQPQTIAITEYNNATRTGVAAGGEWIELYNYGTTAVTMTDWRMRDDDSKNVIIPTTTIAPKDFLVIASQKATLEKLYFKGVPQSKIVEAVFAMTDTGSEELVLYNNASPTRQVVWRLAYGAAANGNSGASTYYAETDFSVTNHGTKTNVINRNGNDSLTGLVGYEGQEHRPESVAFGGGGDVGSPLRGNYPGANNPPAGPTNWTLNAGGSGTTLHPGVRGLAIADQALNRGDNSDQTGILPSVERVTGSALRGVSGGLNADIYDWKTRNAGPRPSTLQFLKWARDSNSELHVTANIRGLTEPDPDVPNFRRYYTTDTAVLASLAADWVRYTNRIAQIYRQGDTVSDARDAAILSQLTWSTGYVSPWNSVDNYPTLLAPSEAAVPKVKYWEIGNEPLVSLANAYSTTNAYTFAGTAGNSTFADYVARYKAITTAMLAEDPTIKVGPCIVNARSGNNADILTLLLQSDARIDFIAYHPYGSMGDYAANAPVTKVSYPNSAGYQEAYLSGVHREQELFLSDIQSLVATYRPAQVNTMEYSASETNVSDFRTNNEFQESTMAHALGSVESIFSWARQGLVAAHYWIWITAGSYAYPCDANRYPVTMAWEMLRDRLGDRLLGSFDSHDDIRVHVVKNTSNRDICVWAMNFSNTTDYNFQLSLTGATTAALSEVKKEVLKNPSGATSLFSFSAPTGLNCDGVVRQVNWTAPEAMPGADPANLALSLPASTLTLITIKNLSPTSAEDWMLFN